MRLPLSLSFIVLVSLGACTGVAYNHEPVEFTVGDIGDGSFEGPNEAWQIEGTTHKITGFDQGGGLCAILATSSGGYNARSEARAQAVKDGRSSYNYQYRLHSADEYSNGQCSLWARFGGADSTLKYNAAEGSDTMSGQTPGSATLREYGLDIQPPGWQPFGGVFLRGYFRFAGGSIKIKPTEEGNTTPEVDSYVQDFAAGGFLDLVPGWAYGLGLHVYLHYGYLRGTWSTGSLIDTTVKLGDYAAKIGIGIDDRELDYYEELPIRAHGTTYLLSINFSDLYDR